MTLKIDNTEDTIKGILTGRLDTAAAQQFAIDMAPLMNNADKHVVLDCNNLSFISSSGLRLFLSLRKASIAKGGDVTLRFKQDCFFHRRLIKQVIATRRSSLCVESSLERIRIDVSSSVNIRCHISLH